MEFSTTWDIDKYKSEFESEEHWNLRRRFMETHKTRFPEDKLVCLASVFFNIEFLGCRYPEKTMQLIAELSDGVADEHREKRKNKLKRTFVQASDAASAKIKRSSNPAESPAKKSKTDVPSTSSADPKQICFVHESMDQSEKIQEQGDFPGFIIFHSCNTRGEMETCPINILTMSAQKCPKWSPIKFTFLQNPSGSGQKYCEITLNNKLLATGVGTSQKDARIAAATFGLNLLRQSCYTIEAKCKYFSEENTLSKSEVNIVPRKVDNPLPMDNIGSRMMMKMGWTGSGLGKNKQGIQTPVQAAPKMIQRTGFGHFALNDLRKTFKKTFIEFASDDSHSDLVFSPDFNNIERKELHRLANSLKLKTRSFGKDNNRHLVVFKNFSLQEILDNLLSCGGENSKYLLIPPKPDSLIILPSKSLKKQNIPNLFVYEDRHPCTYIRQQLRNNMIIEDPAKILEEKPSVIVEKQKTSDIFIKRKASDIVKNQEPSNSVTKGKASNVQKQEASNPVIKGKPSDIVLKQEPSNVVLKENSFDFALKEESCNMIEENAPSIPIKKDPSNIELLPVKNESMSKTDPNIMNDSIGAIVAEEYIKMASPCSNADVGVYFINEIINNRINSLKGNQEKYDQLISILKSHKILTKKERRVYKACRNQIEMLTGCLMDDIFMPDLNMGLPTSRFRSKNKEKKEGLLLTYYHESLGAGLVQQYPLLKGAICQQVKKKLATKDLNVAEHKKRLRQIRKEFQVIGEVYEAKCNGVDIKPEEIAQPCLNNKSPATQLRKVIKEKRKYLKLQNKATKSIPGYKSKTVVVSKLRKLQLIRFQKGSNDIVIQ